MLGHSTPLTVYEAIWADETVATLCRACGRLETLDLRRLALNGHGRERLADIPFECVCGSGDQQMVAASPQTGATMELSHQHRLSAA